MTKLRKVAIVVVVAFAILFLTGAIMCTIY